MFTSSQSLTKKKRRCLYCYIYYAGKENNLQSVWILGAYYRTHVILKNVVIEFVLKKNKESKEKMV